MTSTYPHEIAVEQTVARYVEIVDANGTVDDVLDMLDDTSGGYVEIAYELDETAGDAGFRPGAVTDHRCHRGDDACPACRWFDRLVAVARGPLADRLRAVTS